MKLNNRGVVVIAWGALLLILGLQAAVFGTAVAIDHHVNKENYRTKKPQMAWGHVGWEDKVKLSIDPKAENKGFIYTDVKRAQEAGYLDASGVQKV